MIASYEETIGAITNVQWQRVRVAASGAFIATNTGNLVICTRNANMYDLFQTSYISFVRTLAGRDEFCSSIRVLLMKKFAPKKEDEVFQLAKTTDSILTIPLPIMLKENDQIEIFRIIKGRPRGKKWDISEKYD